MGWPTIVGKVEIKMQSPGWGAEPWPAPPATFSPEMADRFVIVEGPSGKREAMRLSAEQLKAMGFVDRDGDEGMLGFDLPMPKVDPTLAPDEWRMSTPVGEVIYHQHAVIHSDPGALAALSAGFKRMTESAKGLGGAMGGMSSVLDKVHAMNLAQRAQRTATAKLTRIAERSRDPMKRAAARIELLARMAPAPLPVMRDDWDLLPDAEPDGIVRRP